MHPVVTTALRGGVIVLILCLGTLTPGKGKSVFSARHGAGLRRGLPDRSCLIQKAFALRSVYVGHTPFRRQVDWRTLTMMEERLGGEGSPPERLEGFLGRALTSPTFLREACGSAGVGSWGLTWPALLGFPSE